MSVDDIKKNITKLSDKERAKLRAWLDELDEAAWDKQIEEDAQNGKLDKLIAESEADFRAGRYRDL